MAALLFDGNLSRKLVRGLSDLFPSSEHVCFLGLSQGDDYLVWDYARSGGLCLVSADADFFEIATSQGAPPKLIWLRDCNYQGAEAEDRIRGQAARISAFLEDPESAVLILRKT